MNDNLLASHAVLLSSVRHTLAEVSRKLDKLSRWRRVRDLAIVLLILFTPLGLYANHLRADTNHNSICAMGEILIESAEDVPQERIEAFRALIESKVGECD
jgi:hypothetical protein